MPPSKCLICGKADATCGQPTAHRIVPVDGKVTGYIVAGGKLVPDPNQLQAVLGDMTDEEREEFMIMSSLSESRKLRNQVAAGPLAHTYLVYVQCVDGITRKMTQEQADAYMATYGSMDGVEIVKSGDREAPDPDAPHPGATKAAIGPMFGDDGRQMADVQPMTTRSFYAADMGREDVHTPALGATGTDIDNDASVTSSSATNPRVHVPRAGAARRGENTPPENQNQSE